MNVKEKREQQLGMPMSTATKKLLRLVLFDLLKQLGKDVCFRCKNKIRTLKELSLDHKTAWLHNDAALFWALDNIAFSHLRCNTATRRFSGGIGKRKVGPNGTNWCSRCQAFLSTVKFHKSKQRWNGFDQFCKKCRSTLNKISYAQRKAH